MISTSPLRIVGQGLAGSLLAWHCERAGIPFQLFDRAGGSAASEVAAGILNPITGQRVVKSSRVDELLPLAVKTYREIERVVEEQILFPMRVRRIFRDEREREVAIEKHARGELSPYVKEVERDGFWIESAYHLDTRKLVHHLRKRWIAAGLMVVVAADAQETDSDHAASPALTIRCVGAGELAQAPFAFAGLRAAKGQILSVDCEALQPGVILNDGHWVLPVGPKRARVGATFERDATDLAITAEARSVLVASATRLLGADYRVTGQDAGIRVTTMDRHPIAGFHPVHSSCGVINGLGSKGGLWAPWLARQWLAHLREGSAFDRAVDVRRFWR